MPDPQATPPATPQAPPHPLLSYFVVGHLPTHLAAVSTWCAVLATDMSARLPDGPQKDAGMQKLLEAKDCFVRAALVTARGEGR